MDNVLAACEVAPPKTNVIGKNGKVGVLEVVSPGGETGGNLEKTCDKI